MSHDGLWLVESIAVGGELVPPLPGTDLSLEFVDGRVAGSTGINRFTGVVANDPMFGTLATTMMTGPADHMSQERFYLDHLGSIDSYEVDADEMRLITEGLVVVTLKRPGTDQPSKTS